jgi:hypothetical protein
MVLQPRNKVFQSSQKTSGALRIMHVSRRHVERERDTQGIDQEMPLAAFHSFMGIKAADVG